MPQHNVIPFLSRFRSRRVDDADQGLINPVLVEAEKLHTSTMVTPGASPEKEGRRQSNSRRARKRASLDKHTQPNVEAARVATNHDALPAKDNVYTKPASGWVIQTAYSNPSPTPRMECSAMT